MVFYNMSEKMFFNLEKHTIFHTPYYIFKAIIFSF